MNLFGPVNRFKKDSEREAFLRDLNTCIAPLEQEYSGGLSDPSLPVIFIVGTPRSGSTLLAQMLPACLRLGYVSNLMARYYRAPSVGARLQNLLLPRPSCVTDFRAEYGYTHEIESTHEFGYFWSQWFCLNRHHEMDRGQLPEKEWSRLCREVAGMEKCFQAPMLFKNIVLSLNIGILAELFPRSLFLDLRRSPYATAESILCARQRFNRNESEWWSLRPREFGGLSGLNPFQQIAGQITLSRKRIEEQLSQIPANRQLTFSLGELCTKPESILAEVKEIVEQHGVKLEQYSAAPAHFNYSDDKIPLRHHAEFRQAFDWAENRCAQPL